MAWSRFEAGFSRNPKLLRAGVTAAWVWACGVDACSLSLTDGFIDDATAASLVPGMHWRTLRKAIDALVAQGLWVKAPGGYMVHDYLEYNPSRDKIKREREASKSRYEKWLAGQEKRKLNNAAANASDEHVGEDATNGPRSVGRSVNPPISPTSQPHLSPEQQRRHAELATRLNRPIAGSTAPPAAWRHDCPQPVWHGRCVDRAWAAAHPDVSMPVVPDDRGGYRPRECPHHKAQP